MSATSRKHILIIGAGISGLCLAQGLKQAGIPHTVFEAEESHTYRPREWTMIIHWSLPLLQKLLPEHLSHRIKQDASVDPSLDYDAYPNNVVRIYDGRTGQVLKELPNESRSVRVSRRKLRRLCSEGIDVQYGHVVQSVEDSGDHEIIVNFTNGSQAKGSILIGADGVHSTVRDCLFGHGNAAVTSMPLAHVNTTFKYATAEQAVHARSAHPVWSLMHHPQCFGLLSVQDAEDPTRPETWRFQLVLGWLADGNKDDARKQMIERSANVAEPYRSAVHCITDDVDVQFQNISYWMAEPGDTHQGRITLAGDAAHPMPPYRGQGLNNAIQDSYNLLEAIRKVEAGGDRTEIIQECSNEIAKRGAAETVLSRDTGLASADWERLKQSPLFRHSLGRVDSPKD